MLASRDTPRIPLPHLSLGILVTGMLLAAIYGSLTEQGQLELWMQGAIPVIAAGIIFYAIKRGLPFVGSWSLYGVGLLVRAAGHLLPSIPSLRFASPAAILGGQLALFLIGSSILVAGIALYLYSHSQRWPRFRLYIDVLFIFIFLVMMTFNLVYEKARYSPTDPLIRAEAVFITLVYFLTAALIVSLLGHLNFKEVRFSQILLSIGIGLLILSGILRMLAVYQLALINSQIQNRLVTVSYFFFAISALYMNRHPDISENMILTSVQSLRRFFGFSVMIFIIALGFLTRLIEGLVFIRIAFVAVWYFLAQHMVSILAVNERLLEEHHRYTDRLEDMVRERTRKVTEINNELEQAAFNDPLTGMRSRKFMLDQITSLLEKKLPFSLFLIDLVHFRYVNDIHGNEMGDLLLQAVGEDSRRARNSNLITARMGDDEFAAVLLNQNPSEIILAAENITTAIESPKTIKSYLFHLKCKIGIVSYPQDGQSADELLRCANLALIEAKKSADGSNYRLYSREISEAAERRIQLEYLLQHMDPDANFLMYFQPQFEIPTRKLVGMEALLRWFHTDYGFISPAEFIPIAESSGMVHRLTEWTLRKGMQQIRTWNEAYGTNLKLGINLSPRLLDLDSLYTLIAQLLEETGAKPQWLNLELTEYSAIDDNVLEKISHRLSKMGISLSLDDFGTGYSSFSYLVRLQAANLKIAKELIDHIASNKVDQNIVKAIVTMADELGMHTIAEGVETQQQWDALAALNCTAVQGRFTGAPHPPDVFERLFIKPAFAPGEVRQ